jgi:hypothetical protein
MVCGHDVNYAVARSRRTDVPECGGRAMAEGRTVADRQQHRGLVTELNRRIVSNGKDAAKEGVELTCGD